MTAKKPVRVLIVDDSALVRKILATGMGKDPEIQVIGQASNPYQARDILVEQRPDVMTLDLEMPRMDGITFLKRFMPVLPTPTVIISSLTQEGKRATLDALAAGAVDVIPKPAVGVVDGLPVLTEEINRRVKAAACADVSRYAQRHQPVPAVEAGTLHETTDRVIAIGSSTGGVEALARILPAFPAASPGVVIVQHMPQGFTATFAERLDSVCQMRAKEAQHGDRVLAGQILLAPGGSRHMALARSGGEYRVQLVDGAPVNYSRPSVDVLFQSVAREAGRNAAAALLTGMGKDGAEGLLAIRQAGGRTVAQDEASCVVFGMPQVAQSLGAAETMAPLEAIPALLLGAFGQK